MLKRTQVAVQKKHDIMIPFSILSGLGIKMKRKITNE